jgi:hypothetical protein
VKGGGCDVSGYPQLCPARRAEAGVKGANKTICSVALTGSEVPPLSLAARSLAWTASYLVSEPLNGFDGYG